MTNAEKRAATYERWKREKRCVNCGNRVLAPGTILCFKCRDRNREVSLAYYRRCRDAAFAAYGGARCRCCAETQFVFLTIDHIEGGGTAHRREIDKAYGNNKFYVWLKKNGYPAGYQVLCQNCNVGRWRNGGVCPHASDDPAGVADRAEPAGSPVRRDLRHAGERTIDRHPGS